jgi:hypothetical protein
MDTYIQGMVEDQEWKQYTPFVEVATSRVDKYIDYFQIHSGGDDAALRDVAEANKALQKIAQVMVRRRILAADLPQRPC